MTEWIFWIRENWHALRAGRKLCVPEGWLGHPGHFPQRFKRVDGWPMSQTCDWALPLDDGSRIHVQCYRSKVGEPMLCVHRDRWDPELDLGSFVLHALFETPLMPALAGTAVLMSLRS